MITPDSIPNPPSAVGSADGTPVYAGSLVTTQYKGVGLNFSSGAAITGLNGVNVWAPTLWLMEPASRTAGGPPSNFPSAQISYYSTLTGSLVSSGSLNPTTVSSLSVAIVGHPLLTINVYGANGQLLNIAPQIGFLANSQVWTFTGPGISSFSTVEAAIDPPGNVNPVWGVSGVSFAVASTPEPSSLVLVGLGALGLAARLGWRRFRTIAGPLRA
jgi:hypothetical protein